MKKYDHFLGVGEKVLSVLSSPTYSGISLLKKDIAYFVMPHLMGHLLLV
jgi:hypothetical protein